MLNSATILACSHIFLTPGPAVPVTLVTSSRALSTSCSDRSDHALELVMFFVVGGFSREEDRVFISY